MNLDCFFAMSTSTLCFLLPIYPNLSRSVGDLEVVLHYPQNDFVSLLGYYSQKKSAKMSIFFNFGSHEGLAVIGLDLVFFPMIGYL